MIPKGTRGQGFKGSSEMLLKPLKDPRVRGSKDSSEKQKNVQRKKRRYY